MLKKIIGLPSIKLRPLPSHLVFSNDAIKDAKKLSTTGLKYKTQALLEIS
jgi:hypothetical protein